MIPTTFNEQNFTFKKPSAMSDEECSDLNAWKGKNTDGYPVIISKWQPSYEDIQAINRGDGIYLEIYGSGMPPVSIYTENPFVQQEVQ